ncbi:MAG: HNH endonuclease, partial [Chloroflexi bacterium]|nr:HNH endonuclease [Chloroflexota bacterium]
MGAHCLFCRGTLTGAASQEHIIPRSLGGAGWLTTCDVCVTCNS